MSDTTRIHTQFFAKRNKIYHKKTFSRHKKTFSVTRKLFIGTRKPFKSHKKTLLKLKLFAKIKRNYRKVVPFLLYIHRLVLYVITKKFLFIPNNSSHKSSLAILLFLFKFRKNFQKLTLIS